MTHSAFLLPLLAAVALAQGSNPSPETGNEKPSLTPAPSKDWPEWRGGPLRDGRWSNPSLPPTLPADGPALVWKTTIGGGYSGPAVTGGRVYVMDRLVPPTVEQEVERVVCLDAKDGRILWTYSHPSTLHLAGGYANGPRATPTVRDGKVYALGAMDNLSCLDALTGKVVWEADLLAEYHAKIPQWGVANSPVVEKDLVIVQAGGSGSATVMAFNKETGRPVWRALSDKAGYASMIGIDSGGARQLIVWTAAAVSSLNPATGEIYWREPRVEKMDQTLATPVFDPKSNRLIVCSDRDGTTAYQLGDDKPRARKLWENFSLSCLHSIPVLKDSFIYGLNHDGDRLEHCGEFRCVELASGKLEWAVTNLTRLGIWAQAQTTLNTGTDTFYLSNELGELILARAGPEGYRELARAQITGRTWSHPAYVGNQMFARSETTLFCVALDR
jgi:outer membrane protein assembly factor BamB